ncbi:Hypothetical predicted protein [Mytilus galloprovincialis]|uniref:OTU domain-containing protein n=1 Tax=Mytilus galloprovincialis TaxID=29158 RepID=A0A8B6G6F4_MYTGA|nr:Hypothetical predicted protein [Mytilus galloprovincialis]
MWTDRFNDGIVFANTAQNRQSYAQWYEGLTRVVQVKSFCAKPTRQGISHLDIRGTKLFLTITDCFCTPRKEINSIVEIRNNCSHSTDISEENFKKCWSTLRDNINNIESITESKLWTEEIIDRLEKKLNIENLLKEIKTDVEQIIGNEKDSQKILQKKMVQIYVALKKLISKPTKNNPAQAFTSLSHKNYTEQSICLHPKQFKLKLLKLYKEIESDAEEAEKRLKENCLNLNLTFRNETPRNGNCFFDAVSSQLKDLGLKERSAEEIRKNVIDYLMENREFQGVDGNVNIEHFIDDRSFEDWARNMKHSGVFADHVVVLGMARMLETNILIVTSNPQANSENNMTYIVGKMDYNKIPILLGHVWENHYHSLISLDASIGNDRLADNNTELCKMQSQNIRPSIIDSCITALNEIKSDSSPSNYEVTKADIFVTVKDRTVIREMKIIGKEQVFEPDVRVIEIPCSSSNSLMKNINRDADSDCDDDDLFVCGKCRRFFTTIESLVTHKRESIRCMQKKSKNEKNKSDTSAIPIEQNMTPDEQKEKRFMCKQFNGSLVVSIVQVAVNKNTLDQTRENGTEHGNITSNDCKILSERSDVHKVLLNYIGVESCICDKHNALLLLKINKNARI